MPSQFNRFYHGYCIARGYRKVTIWAFGKVTGSLVCTLVVKPKPELSRRQKFNEICRTLQRDSKFICPCYKLTRSEAKKKRHRSTHNKKTYAHSSTTN